MQLIFNIFFETLLCLVIVTWLIVKDSRIEASYLVANNTKFMQLFNANLFSTPKISYI